jgi:hypothetical protein
VAIAGKTRFFSSLPKRVVQHLQSRPYAMENHAHGLAWTAVEENPRLRDFFEVLSLSVDRAGQVYVSTMEAKQYPITGVQWCAGRRGGRGVGGLPKCCCQTYAWSGAAGTLPQRACRACTR